VRWLAVYAVTYPFTFCGVIIPQLMVLDRIACFSNLKDASASSENTIWNRALYALFLIGNVVGLCGNIASAVFVLQAANFYDVVVARNDSSARSAAIFHLSEGAKASSIHISFETCMVLIILVASSIAGYSSCRRIYATLSAVENEQLDKLSVMFNIPQDPASSVVLKQKRERAILSGQLLRRQIACTSVIIFISFLMRSVFMIMFAVGAGLQNSSDACVSGYVNRCSSCYNTYTHLLIWILYTPEFTFVLVLISQPISLIVSLWGMTSGNMLETMRAHHSESQTTNLL
jgi:hypothetical protein